MSLQALDYGPASEDLQLPPMLDDTIFDSFFDAFPLELPPLHQVPPSKNPIQADETWFRPSTSSRAQDLTFDGQNFATSNSKDGQISGGHAAKNAVPLAEVLNEDQPVEEIRRPSQDYESFSRRKIRRIEEDPRDDIWQLPRPNVTKSLESAPLIPPLLQGLHEPPPDAGLIPPITDGSSNIFTRRIKFPDAPPGLPTRPLHDLPPFDLPSFRIDLNESQTFNKLGVRTESTRSTKPERPSKQPVIKSQKRSQSAKNRNPWSEKETRDLLQGVAKYGIGRWKEILASKEYTFHDRSAVDLKDRFRVCRPQDYLSSTNVSSGAQRSRAEIRQDDRPGNVGLSSRTKFVGYAESSNHAPTQNVPSTALPFKKPNRKKVEVSLPEVGITEPLVRRERRTRHSFTEEEDTALLRGFEAHGPKWRKILEENGLDTQGRTSRDLRDRLRNRWPERYERAGLKPGGKGEERRRINMGRNKEKDTAR